MALRLFLRTRGTLDCRKVLSTSQLNYNRHFNNSSNEKSLYKHAEAKKFRLFVIDRYFDYLKNYEKVLERRFPKAMDLYRTFMLGVKEFYKDTKHFVKLVGIINAPGNSLKSFTRREIELYDRMPKDMLKVAPVLILSTLPLANYVIFPLIYMFPKQMLCHHFWTAEQKQCFEREYLFARLSYGGKVFEELARVTSMKGQANESWTEVVETLRRGDTPTVELILSCRELFATRPFHLIYLSRRHVRNLLKAHDLHVGWFRRVRLGDRALILKAMDHAILMEGGIHNLSHDALKRACIIRGLNPTNLTDEKMIKWLQKWMDISNAVDKGCLSLLLHAPIFLGHNEPTNRVPSKK